MTEAPNKPAYGTERLGNKTRFWIGNSYFTLEDLAFGDDPVEAEAVTELVRNMLADGLAELAGDK